MADIELEGICKRFGEVSVIEDLDLYIRDEELMVIVGPSGCGKSTVLRMIAGLEPISAGTLSIGGRVVNHIHPKDRDTAMVFQSYALYPHMTVRDNIGFGLRIRKMPRPEVDRLIDETAQALGLTELLDRKPKALSGGQRQRVALGRAIVRKPAVFLFDEPLSNLDAELRVLMRAEISQLQKRLKTTSVYVTHDQVEAMTMGHRICVLKEGKLMQVGTPLELYDTPGNLFVARFIGTPPMNTVKGAISEDGTRIEAYGFNLPVSDKNLPMTGAHRGRTVMVGFRPDDVTEPHPGQPSLTAVFEGEVKAVEPLGNAVIVHVLIGEHRIVAKLDPHTIPSFGERIPLAVDCANLHLFDEATEQRLGDAVHDAAIDR
ncbi:MAG: sn-glycerol-3-phosphate ABC transporter ATP-binding protein UgpC [Deltaproteobacteria bacterium]|nr:sn-glycerol-3-phosphate ABC transporter ATP-binding protein UgpC [Deltaproteobacteria bacterium]